MLLYIQKIDWFPIGKVSRKGKLWKSPSPHLEWIQPFLSRRSRFLSFPLDRCAFFLDFFQSFKIPRLDMIPNVDLSELNRRKSTFRSSVRLRSSWWQNFTSDRRREWPQKDLISVRGDFENFISLKRVIFRKLHLPVSLKTFSPSLTFPGFQFLTHKSLIGKRSTTSIQSDEHTYHFVHVFFWRWDYFFDRLPHGTWCVVKNPAFYLPIKMLWDRARRETNSNLVRSNFGR